MDWIKKKLFFYHPANHHPGGSSVLVSKSCFWEVVSDGSQGRSSERKSVAHWETRIWVDVFQQCAVVRAGQSGVSGLLSGAEKMLLQGPGCRFLVPQSAECLRPVARLPCRGHQGCGRRDKHQCPWLVSGNGSGRQPWEVTWSMASIQSLKLALGRL